MTTPKLRFKQFDNAWRKVKLQEITSRIGDGLHSTPEYDEEGIIYFANGSNIKNGVLVFDENTKTINEDELSKYKVHLEHNSILVSLNGATWGRFGLYNGEKILLGKSLGYINTLDSHTAKHFIYYQLQLRKIRKFFESDITGSTIKNLSLQTLRNTEVYLPSIEEQKKIANFLIVIDKKIQLQQEKIDLLKEQKKGYMQRIFNQELRFKDSQGVTYPDWENHILGDLGTTYTGLSGKTKEDFGYGDHSFITYVNVFNNLFANESGIEKVNILDNENQATVKKGDILLTTSSETPLEVGMASIWNFSTQNLHLNSFCFGYRLNDDNGILPEFVAISLRSEYMRKKIVLLAQGSTRFNMSKTELMRQTIKIPSSFEEQRKIVDFYMSLDSKVKTANQKLELLYQQKKAFMQQMFI